MAAPDPASNPASNPFWSDLGDYDDRDAERARELRRRQSDEKLWS